jgi:hypothetical protein
MELKPNVDSDIQRELFSNRIAFPVDDKGKIAIHEFRMDAQAGAGMLYILPENNLPKGTLPFLAGLAEGVYGVFHFEGKAAIIEVSTGALDGEIEDWHLKNRK